MKILVAQIDLIIGDREGNSQKIIRLLYLARKKELDVILFPEMSICAYPPEDLVIHTDFVLAMEAMLQKNYSCNNGVNVGF